MAERPATPAQWAFVDYFRCPGHLAAFDTSTLLSKTSGYFRFGKAHCFGRAAGTEPLPQVTDRLADVNGSVDQAPTGLVLPFDLAEVVTNLRQERYCHNGYPFLTQITSGPLAQEIYYRLRPFMPVGVRKHLQHVRLTGWERIPFPKWPVDSTVDELMRQTLRLLLNSNGGERVPFIWFWPEEAPSCTMLTHDVEGQAGLEFCGQLMDLDERYGMKAAFQLIPEAASDAWQYAAEIRRRGFEANLHDLNHDGRLYRDKPLFLDRARRINEYARRFGCGGFRSGAMYRQQGWYEAYEFAYDMSVPSAAHLEPQRGGCCTVMPYFVGKVLELPLTTTQDYSLFFILGDYSTALWREQIEMIRAQHGLISIITHPDYLVGERERAVYTELLDHLAQLRDSGQTWVALPGEINRWWRDRQRMTLVSAESSWRVAGPGSERATVAYASLEGDRVVYSFDRAT
jgi:hypothetical protein